MIAMNAHGIHKPHSFVMMWIKMDETSGSVPSLSPVASVSAPLSLFVAAVGKPPRRGPLATMTLLATTLLLALAISVLYSGIKKYVAFRQVLASIKYVCRASPFGIALLHLFDVVISPGFELCFRIRAYSHSLCGRYPASSIVVTFHFGTNTSSTRSSGWTCSPSYVSSSMTWLRPRAAYRNSSTGLSAPSGPAYSVPSGPSGHKGGYVVQKIQWELADSGIGSRACAYTIPEADTALRSAGVLWEKLGRIGT